VSNTACATRSSRAEARHDPDARGNEACDPPWPVVADGAVDGAAVGADAGVDMPPGGGGGGCCDGGGSPAGSLGLTGLVLVAVFRRRRFRGC
jgi:uncharacterized protein (TIGR03382 family)